MSLQIIICLATFGFVTALVAAVAFMLRGNSSTNLEDRLSLLTGTSQSAKNKQAALLKESVLAETWQSKFDFVELLVSKFNLRILFEQADAPLSLQRFFAVSGICALIGGAAGVLTRMNPGVTLLLAGSMLPLPLVWLIFRRKRRLSKFAKQLPDAMELIARALRPGIAWPRASTSWPAK